MPTVTSSAALCEPTVRFSLDAEGRPITGLSTQMDLDDALQELFAAHMKRHAKVLEGKSVYHEARIMGEDPLSPVPAEGAYLVIETSFKS